jgi:transcriptional regulator with XRE-family HTH domain
MVKEIVKSAEPKIAPGVKTLGGKPCAEARKLLGWSRKDLAEAALVALRTVDALEEGRSRPHPRAVENIRIALEAAGARFGGDGVERAGAAQPQARAAERPQRRVA